MKRNDVRAALGATRQQAVKVSVPISPVAANERRSVPAPASDSAASATPSAPHANEVGRLTDPGLTARASPAPRAPPNSCAATIVPKADAVPSNAPVRTRMAATSKNNPAAPVAAAAIRMAAPRAATPPRRASPQQVRQGGVVRGRRAPRPPLS